MRRNAKMSRFVGVALFLFSSICLAAFDLNKIPDGYPAGRHTAPYGAYNTPYEGKAKAISDTLDSLEPKIYGLPQYSPTNEIQQAEAVYFLEHVVVGLMQQISQSAPQELTTFEKDSLIFRTSNLYHHVRNEGERLYELMIRKIDVALPGPNGAQLRYEDTASGEVFYFSNCRDEKCPTKKEQRAFYDKKLKEFLAAGGNANEMHPLTKALLNSYQGTVRVEYVQRPNGEIWVTKGNAGHALLAAGGPVKGAGQIVFVMGRDGKIQYLVVSNASGTYKPDLLSAKNTADKIASQFGVSSSQIMTTEGEPLGNQTVKVLMKAANVPSAEIKTKMAELDLEAKEFFNGSKLKHQPAGHSNNADCKTVFGKIQ